MKWVRDLIGPYAGQLRQFPDHVAENLIDTGFGEYPTATEVEEYLRWLNGDVETATLPTEETPEAPRPPAPAGGAEGEPRPKKTAAKKKLSRKK